MIPQSLIGIKDEKDEIKPVVELKSYDKNKAVENIKKLQKMEAKYV